MIEIGDKVYLKETAITGTGVAHPVDKEFFVVGRADGMVGLSHTPGGSNVLITSQNSVTPDKIPTTLWEHLEGQGDDE